MVGGRAGLGETTPRYSTYLCGEAVAVVDYLPRRSSLGPQTGATRATKTVQVRFMSAGTRVACLCLGVHGWCMGSMAWHGSDPGADKGNR